MSVINEELPIKNIVVKLKIKLVPLLIWLVAIWRGLNISFSYLENKRERERLIDE